MDIVLYCMTSHDVVKGNTNSIRPLPTISVHQSHQIWEPSCRTCGFGVIPPCWESIGISQGPILASGNTFLTTKLGTSWNHELSEYNEYNADCTVVLVTSRSAFSLISPELALWNHSRSASESWLYGRPQLGMLGLRRHGLSPSEGSIRVTVELL